MKSQKTPDLLHKSREHIKLSTSYAHMHQGALAVANAVGQGFDKAAQFKRKSDDHYEIGKSAANAHFWMRENDPSYTYAATTHPDYEYYT